MGGYEKEVSMRAEELEVKASPREELARWVSSIVHPIAFPLATLWIVSFAQAGSAPASTLWVVLALLLTSLPISILVISQVIAGRWTDLDVSVRRQRYLLYPFGILCMALLVLTYMHFHAPSIAVRATVSLALANVIDGVINLVYKVSAHATGASICAMLLWVATPLFGVPGALAALAVGWSRVELKRHTPGQVGIGWLVGVASTVLAMHLKLPR